MEWNLDTFITQVTERAHYDRPQQGARAVRNVLEVLGAHLVGDDRTDLAALLPEGCGPLLTAAEPASEPLSPASFVRAVADHSNEDLAEARREIDAVLPTLADAADHALLRRLLTQLPPGHAGLFGCTDPG
ncbi:MULTISPECIES: DUF2267 domain-containing protein [unclassified Streptomyces]|uniref:DUF2267 domain-containing protein n=1 Tax=unclassified Streptomyces TaxID=2593676 RepID=UPI000DB92A08|nr:MULTISPECIES: DUF2267 domain-containing protein [Streptomyces]MYU07314.1 DUF2267 domain-containing protein [Streptomyces sp. SID8366]MYU65362.1 DUF2267 domain-containing protein [Streptomyces sp. SID69]RAJ61567.1 uncharacterized protein (DUF2267 family) [Streptomyces sp. PsTaAH-130]TXJ78695.1 DUF2267 domain-containing protein [Streptomyces lavendulae]